MPLGVRQALTIFAIIGFVASLLTHLTTFFGVSVAQYFPWIWILHIGIFIVMIPVVISQRNRSGSWERMLTLLPNWGKVALPIFFVYALINFALFLFLSQSGVPAIRDGKFVLASHGHVVRELSKQEYEQQEAYVLRGFSGHWMIFYLVPALHGLYREE